MTSNKNIIIDTISGIVSGFCVAPFVSIIDKSITKNASGASTLFRSINTDILKSSPYSTASKHVPRTHVLTRHVF